jgi:hypothetical protein
VNDAEATQGPKLRAGFTDAPANTDRRDERIFGFLGCKHEDGEDEVGS